jgi:hypothetical protein
VGVIVGVAVIEGVLVTVAVSVVVGVGVAVAVGTGVAVAVGVGTGESVGVSVGVAVSVAVRVGGTVSVTLGVGVIVAVWVTVAVDVGVRDVVGVTLTVKLAVGDAVTLGITVSVTVGLGVRVPVSEGVGVDAAVGTTVSVGVVVAVTVPVAVGGSVRPGVGEAAGAAKRATSASKSAAVTRPSPLTSAVAHVVGFASATVSARRSSPFNTPLQSASPGSAATAVAVRNILARKPTTSDRTTRGSTKPQGTAQSCPRATLFARYIIPSILIRAPAHGVSVGVGVATRTTICAGGPVLPRTSRSLAVTRESPVGKTAVVATKSQNCTVAPAVISFGSPEASMNVHGAAAENCWKRHAKSFNASVIIGSLAKLGGATPGTPPPPEEAGPTSHTVRLPFPMARLLSIWRSGRASAPG